MKIKNRFLISALVLIASISLFSCEKDDNDVSFITTYPTFEMSGDRYMSVVQGSTYSEPGVTANEGEPELEVTTSGTVDVNTVGVYNIVYSAVNSDGFAGNVTRTVAVLPEAEQEGVDISGDYQNVGSFNYTAAVTKLAPGFYKSTNVWGGGSAAVIPAYVISINGTDLLLPISSLSGYGRVNGTGTLDASGLMTLTVSLLDQGVSDSVKKWQKQ